MRQLYRKLILRGGDIASRAEVIKKEITSRVDREIALRLLEEELDQRAENMRRIQLLLQLI